MPGETRKHRFFHMGDYRGGVRCDYCDVERVLLPNSIGFRWISKDGELHIKKPRCIKRK